MSLRQGLLQWLTSVFGFREVVLISAMEPGGRTLIDGYVRNSQGSMAGKAL